MVFAWRCVGDAQMAPNTEAVTLGDFPNGVPVLDRDADNEVFSSDTLKRPAGPLKDFLWTEREQQHAARRRAILKAHPEVRSICRPPPPPPLSLRRA